MLRLLELVSTEGGEKAPVTGRISDSQVSTKLKHLDLENDCLVMDASSTDRVRMPIGINILGRYLYNCLVTRAYCYSRDRWRRLASRACQCM